MFKIRSFVLLSVLLVGCKSLGYTAAEPTASSERIKEVQEGFANSESAEFVKVSDSGVINFKQTVPDGYTWKTQMIMEIGYRVSCHREKGVRNLIEEGFTVIVNFQGHGGTYMEYDENRCIAEDADNVDA